MISVGIIEEHAARRQELKNFINLQEELVCYLACATIKEYLEQVAKGPAILVLIVAIADLTDSPAISSQVYSLKKSLPETDIIILSDNNDSAVVLDCLRAGALGYLLKYTSHQDLKRIIMGVAAGGAYISPYITRKIADFYQSTAPTKDKSGLTSREKEIAHLLTKGFSYKMIAGELNLSLDTVRFHLRNVYKKLEVNSKAEVIAHILKKS